MINSPIQISQLDRTSYGLRRFFKVCYNIYEQDTNWVAPLLLDFRKALSDDNPFFKHAEMKLWVASRGSKDLGRIAAIINHNHNKFHHDNVGFFGFFESINDHEISSALLNTAAQWLKSKGFKKIIGPMNPSTNDDCGLLIEGFDSPPVFMMPYNPKYYIDLLENSGFKKAKDLISFFIDVKKCPIDKLNRIASKAIARNSNIFCKPVKKKTLAEDLEKIKEVYNSAWEHNWGFVPMTSDEIDFMAERLKPIFMEGLVWLAEAGQEPVGFMLALPDYNIPFKPLKGRLLSLNLFKTLPYFLGMKLPHRCRVLTLGVKSEFRNHGLEALMLSRGFEVGIKAGFTEAEASWILEDNIMMCRVIEFFGGIPYKRYRIYEKEI
jgi:GNAT superfamily N-acetyltransferase